MKNMLVID